MWDKKEDVKFFLRNEEYPDRVLFFKDTEYGIGSKLYLPTFYTYSHEEPLEVGIKSMREEANIFLNSIYKLFELKNPNYIAHFYEAEYDGKIRFNDPNKECYWLDIDEINSYDVAFKDDTAASIYLEGIDTEYIDLANIETNKKDLNKY